MLVGATCVACDGDGGPVCPVCAAGLHPAGPVTVDGMDAAWALMRYEGAARELVRGLKYTNRRAALGLLAVAASRLVDEPVDTVTWVPAAPAHRRERGYDQAELLARRVGATLGCPPRRLLARARDRPQTGLDRVDRLAGPALRPVRRTSGAVLVVDDVVTTGGSLGAAARSLRSIGAARAFGLVLAATPPRGPGG